MKARNRAPAALALLVLAATAACGTSDGPATPAPAPPSRPSQPLPPPAEPGDAPAARADLPGTITTLPGGAPEGAVVDPKTETLAVALRDPDRVALREPSGRVRDDAVPGAARHLSLGGPGVVLVPAEDRKTLLQMELPSGHVTGSVPVGRQPHDAVITPAGTAVTNEFGGDITLVRPDQHADTAGGFVQPGGLTATDGRLAVVDVRANTLHVLDAADLHTVAVLPAGQGPSHVRPIGGGRVAVADTRGHAVLTYQITGTPRSLGTTPLAGRAYGLATDPGRGLAYVTMADRNEVVRLRANADGRLAVSRPVPTVAQPNSVAVAPSGAVFVIGQRDAQVQQLTTRDFER